MSLDQKSPMAATASGETAAQEQQQPSTSSNNKDPVVKTYNPPPPRYYESNWQLLSQGAEARIWLIPSYLTTCVINSNKDEDSTTTTKSAICKERFPKCYRHPTLDAQITKSRLKAESKCLVRCRKNGVKCPVMLGVDPANSCLFMELVTGVTVREFFDQSPTKAIEDDLPALPPPLKKSKANTGDATTNENANTTATTTASTTRTDSKAMLVATAIGKLVAEMHNSNVIHGDLTTSNIMLDNPPSNDDDDDDDDENSWKPILTLIDFGLAGVAGSKGVSHEERAVDLYVLERAFVSTHSGSEDLVAEILREYKRICQTSDSVLSRLYNVRQRGRKRECFG